MTQPQIRPPFRVSPRLLPGTPSPRRIIGGQIVGRRRVADTEWMGLLDGARAANCASVASPVDALVLA